VRGHSRGGLDHPPSARGRLHVHGTTQLRTSTDPALSQVGGTSTDPALSGILHFEVTSRPEVSQILVGGQGGRILNSPPLGTLYRTSKWRMYARSIL
jgi:hypothetical protein